MNAAVRRTRSVVAFCNSRSVPALRLIMPSTKKATSSGKKPAKKATRSRATTSTDAAGGPAVLVVGAHPAAWLCALYLQDARVNVAIVEAGEPSLERLVTLNPAFFKLHKALERVRTTLPVTPVRQVRFLGAEGADARSQEPKTANTPELTLVTPLSAVREQLKALALEQGVRVLEGNLGVEGVDEQGAHVRIGRQKVSPRVLAVCDPLDPGLAGPLDARPFSQGQLSMLATSGVTAKGKLTGGVDQEAGVLPLSLELDGAEVWGWLMRHEDRLELSVLSRRARDPEASKALLDRWAAMLRARNLVSDEASPDGRTFQTRPMPLAGALERDVVGRRTLLFGPAGGFLSASGEEVYPACWSAKFAADAAARGAKASHPQDALAAYRGQWGSTLGDYLRGPQQNLQFLMPLVYRNPPMADRLAAAILKGQNLVK